MLRARRRKSIDDVLEEVEVLIDSHFFNEFEEIKSSSFVLKVITNKSVIDLNIYKRTRRSPNCTPNKKKAIQEIQENLPLVCKRRSSPQRRRQS